MNRYTIIVCFGDGGYLQTQKDTENSHKAVMEVMEYLVDFHDNHRPIVSITVAEVKELR